MQKRPAVLLVEDNEDARNIYALMLRTRGLEVAEAVDGREGVRLARELLPSVIVMNFVLPHIDGISATELIKSDPLTAHIPVIACTAFVREDGMEAAEAAGCDSYLEKPCPPSKLVKEVLRLLEPAIASD